MIPDAIYYIKKILAMPGFENFKGLGETLVWEKYLSTQTSTLCWRISPTPVSHQSVQLVSLYHVENAIWDKLGIKCGFDKTQKRREIFDDTSIYGSTFPISDSKTSLTNYWKFLFSELSLTKTDVDDSFKKAVDDSFKKAMAKARKRTIKGGIRIRNPEDAIYYIWEILDLPIFEGKHMALKKTNLMWENSTLGYWFVTPAESIGVLESDVWDVLEIEPVDDLELLFSETPIALKRFEIFACNPSITGEKYPQSISKNNLNAYWEYLHKKLISKLELGKESNDSNKDFFKIIKRKKHKPVKVRNPSQAREESNLLSMIREIGKEIGWNFKSNSPKIRTVFENYYYYFVQISSHGLPVDYMIAQSMKFEEAALIRAGVELRTRPLSTLLKQRIDWRIEQSDVKGLRMYPWPKESVGPPPPMSMVFGEVYTYWEWIYNKMFENKKEFLGIKRKKKSWKGMVRNPSWGTVAVPNIQNEINEGVKAIEDIAELLNKDIKTVEWKWKAPSNGYYTSEGYVAKLVVLERMAARYMGMSIETLRRMYSVKSANKSLQSTSDVEGTLSRVTDYWIWVRNNLRRRTSNELDKNKPIKLSRKKRSWKGMVRNPGKQTNESKEGREIIKKLIAHFDTKPEDYYIHLYKMKRKAFDVWYYDVGFKDGVWYHDLEILILKKMGYHILSLEPKSILEARLNIYRRIGLKLHPSQERQLKEYNLNITDIISDKGTMMGKLVVVSSSQKDLVEYWKYLLEHIDDASKPPKIKRRSQSWKGVVRNPGICHHVGTLKYENDTFYVGLNSASLEHKKIYFSLDACDFGFLVKIGADSNTSNDLFYKGTFRYYEEKLSKMSMDIKSDDNHKVGSVWISDDKDGCVLALDVLQFMEHGFGRVNSNKKNWYKFVPLPIGWDGNVDDFSSGFLYFAPYYSGNNSSPPKIKRRSKSWKGMVRNPKR